MFHFVLRDVRNNTRTSAAMLEAEKDWELLALDSLRDITAWGLGRGLLEPSEVFSNQPLISNTHCFWMVPQNGLPCYLFFFTATNLLLSSELILANMFVRHSSRTSRQCRSAGNACSPVRAVASGTACSAWMRHLPLLANRRVSFCLRASRLSVGLRTLGGLGRLGSSSLMISVTGVLVVGCAGLPWLPPWTLGSVRQFPHQAPTVSWW